MHLFDLRRAVIACVQPEHTGLSLSPMHHRVLQASIFLVLQQVHQVLLLPLGSRVPVQLQHM